MVLYIFSRDKNTHYNEEKIGGVTMNNWLGILTAGFEMMEFIRFIISGFSREVTMERLF